MSANSPSRTRSDYQLGTMRIMESRFKVGDKVRIVRFCRYYGRRADVIQLGSSDLVGVMFADGSAYLFRGGSDLELVSE